MDKKGYDVYWFDGTGYMRRHEKTKNAAIGWIGVLIRNNLAVPDPKFHCMIEIHEGGS